MFLIKFILLFFLFMSIIRVLYEGGRLVLCMLAEKHFETDTWSNVVTTMSFAYIITFIFCGTP